MILVGWRCAYTILNRVHSPPVLAAELFMLVALPTRPRYLPRPVRALAKMQRTLVFLGMPSPVRNRNEFFIFIASVAKTSLLLRL